MAWKIKDQQRIEKKATAQEEDDITSCAIMLVDKFTRGCNFPTLLNMIIVMNKIFFGKTVVNFE